MEQNFLQEKKKQKNLIYILLALVLITVVVVWKGLGGRAEETTITEENFVPQREEIVLDFSVFNNPFLEEATFFPVIQPLAEGVKTGRGNPFLSF